MRIRIAVVQFKINQYKPNKNLIKAEEFIKKASKKADIIVFPEDFLTGGLTNDEIMKLADSTQEFKKIFQKLALKYKIDIVAGSIIEKSKKGYFNVSYYIDSSGKIKARYEKINLWLSERNHISAGNKICVFNTKFGKIGLSICWDLMFPEVFRKMARKGAKIIFCPSLWYKSENFPAYTKYNKNTERDHVNALCQTRAIENNIIFVYTNAVGKIKTSRGSFDEAIGHSQITMPIKGVVKRLGYKEEKMFIQEVNTDILKEEEKAYKIRADLKNTILN